MTSTKENAPLAERSVEVKRDKSGTKPTGNDDGLSIPANVHKENFGAAPGEWVHFSKVLGLTRDLLPVVSDPNAKISEYSTVKDLGKTPSDYNRRGEMRGLLDWTNIIASEKDIERWSADNRLGICIQTREIRAIDVDIEDFDESTEVEAFLLDRLGPAYPCRRRANSCKFLIPFRMAGDFKKRRFLTKTPKSAIEALMSGQQFVAIGTHPSGVRYEWEGGLPSDIPELDVAEFEAVWAALNERFGSEESVTARTGMAPTKKRQLADIADWPFVNHLLETGWASGFMPDGKLAVTCTKEHLHTNDSGPSSTVLLPRGLGGIDQRTLSCKHESCGKPFLADLERESGWALKGFDEIPDPTPEENDAAAVVRIGNDAKKSAGATTESRIDRSDTGNVNILYHFANNNVRYLPERDAWIVWTGSRWEPDTTKSILQATCRKVGEYYHREAQKLRKDADRPSNDADARKRILKAADSVESWAVQCRNGGRLKAMVEQAAMDSRFVLSVEKLDRDPLLLGVQNGVVDLRTGELRPDAREQYVTRRASIEYTPTAIAPRWVQFIDEITAKPITAERDEANDVIPSSVGRYTTRPAYAQFLQKALGYSLTGKTSEQKMFVCVGDGGNGKNIMLDLLQELLPAYVTTIKPAVLLASAKDPDAHAPSEATAALAGYRTAIASESKEGARLDVAVVKAHTGNKFMRARFLNENSFTFEVTHKIWLMTNHKPRIDGLDNAMRGRLHILPFDMQWNRPGTERDPTRPDGDKGLNDKLLSEMPGILAWLVEGARLYLAEGLEPPDEVAANTRTYFKEQSAFESWISERTVVCVDGDGDKASSLFENFRSWCVENGRRLSPDNQTAFSSSLKKADFKSTKTRGIIQYNLKIKVSEDAIEGFADDYADDLI